MPDFKVEIRERLAELQLAPVREGRSLKNFRSIWSRNTSGRSAAARRTTKRAGKSSNNSMRPIC